jgi:hypothetical protein
MENRRWRGVDGIEIASPSRDCWLKYSTSLHFPQMSSSPPLPSNRSFGTLFVVVFALLGAYGWWRSQPLFPWAFGLSALTLAVTLVVPNWLAPANRAWMKLAEILNRIVSPIVLGASFYVVLTPIAIVMRLMGRDAMKRRFEPSVPSYWIDREPPGPDPAGLPNQF